MRLDADELRADRQRETVADDVVRLAGRNIDALAAEAQHHRGAHGRVVGEVEPHAGPDRLRPAGRLHVELDDEVAARLQAPRHPRLGQRRKLPRGPAQEVPVRVVRLRAEGAFVSGRRILFVELPRRARPVEAQVGVVRDPRVAGPELDARDEGGPLDRDRQHEVAKGVGSVGRHIVGVRHRDHDIGHTETPALRPGGLRRHAAQVAGRRSRLGPAPKERHVVVREPAGADEGTAEAGLRLPWRHEAAGRHLHYLPCPPADVVIREQRKGTDLAGPVAGRATRQHDRGDVVGEGRRAGLVRRRQGLRRLRRAGSVREEADGQEGVSGDAPSAAAAHGSGRA